MYANGLRESFLDLQTEIKTVDDLTTTAQTSGRFLFLKEQKLDKSPEIFYDTNFSKTLQLPSIGEGGILQKVPLPNNFSERKNTQHNNSIQIHFLDEQFEKEYPSDWAVLFGMVVGVAVVVAGVFGNFLTIAAYKRNRKLQTSFNFLITNLCSVDLVFSALVIPSHLPLLMFRRSIYDVTLCNLIGYFYYCMLSSSVINLVCIAINRYVGIVHSKRYRLVFCRDKKKWWIIGIWISAPVLYLPFVIADVIRWRPTSLRCALSVGKGDFIGIKIYQVFLNTTLQVVPTILLAALYRAILIKVKRCRKTVEHHPNLRTPSIATSCGGQKEVSRSFRMRKYTDEISNTRENASWGAPKLSLATEKKVSLCNHLAVPQTSPLRRKFPRMADEEYTLQKTNSTEHGKFVTISGAQSAPSLVTSPEPSRSKTTQETEESPQESPSEKTTEPFINISLENDTTVNETTTLPSNDDHCVDYLNNTVKKTVESLEEDRSKTIIGLPMFMGLPICREKSDHKLLRNNAVDEDDVEVADEFFIAKEICALDCRLEDDVFQENNPKTTDGAGGETIVREIIRSLSFKKKRQDFRNSKAVQDVCNDSENISSQVVSGANSPKHLDTAGPSPASPINGFRKWQHSVKWLKPKKSLRKSFKAKQQDSGIKIVVDQATSDDGRHLTINNTPSEEIRHFNDLERVSEMGRETYRLSSSIGDDVSVRSKSFADRNVISEEERCCHGFWDKILKSNVSKKESVSRPKSPMLEISPTHSNGLSTHSNPSFNIKGNEYDGQTSPRTSLSTQVCAATTSIKHQSTEESNSSRTKRVIERQMGVDSSESKPSSPQYLSVGNHQSFLVPLRNPDGPEGIDLGRRWSGQSEALSLYSTRRVSIGSQLGMTYRGSCSGASISRGPTKMKEDKRNSGKLPHRKRSIYQLWSSKKKPSVTSSIGSNSSRRRRRDAERRLAYSGIAICLAFAACVLPTSVVSVLKSLFKIKISANVKFGVAILSWLHAVINPLLYGFLNPQYRLEYKRMFKSAWKCLTCRRDRFGPGRRSALAHTIRQQYNSDAISLRSSFGASSLCCG